MDDKTEDLRDIFIDVAEDDTVTERQEDPRGSLGADEVPDEAAIEEELSDIVGEMRARYGFETDLTDEDLVRVLRGYFQGESDTGIADALGVSRRVVFRARLDLHLLRDRDTDAPFDLADLRELLESDRTVAEIADELDVAASTVRRYRRVVAARNRARRVADRYRSEFEDLLTDAEMTTRMTTDVKENGLEGATEGTEPDSDVSL